MRKSNLRTKRIRNLTPLRRLITFELVLILFNSIDNTSIASFKIERSIGVCGLHMIVDHVPTSNSIIMCSD